LSLPAGEAFTSLRLGRSSHRADTPVWPEFIRIVRVGDWFAEGWSGRQDLNLRPLWPPEAGFFRPNLSRS